jgi:hypothetical protein
VKPPIKIDAVDDEEAAVLRLTQEVAALLSGLPWVLIGGLMVRVIEAEHGAPTGWTTSDVDTLLDVRAFSTATEEAAARLQAANFAPERYGENLTYRFVRGTDIVDVLAPDHLGERARLRTVPPDETLEALGGRQALNRKRMVKVDAGHGPFELPVPSIAGALVIKARVAANTQGRSSQSKHERDLARLLALVRDPPALRDQLTRRERGYFRARSAMLDTDHGAWLNVQKAEDGAITLGILGRGD